MGWLDAVECQAPAGGGGGGVAGPRRRGWGTWGGGAARARVVRRAGRGLRVWETVRAVAVSFGTPISSGPVRPSRRAAARTLSMAVGLTLAVAAESSAPPWWWAPTAGMDALVREV